MKIAALVLNEDGFRIANTAALQLGGIDIYVPERLAEKFPQCSKFSSLKEGVSRVFQLYQGLLFIMATGIVVRIISPYLRSKPLDPAVVAVDKRGRYAISLLGGHSAQANELAKQVAAAIGAEAVITTDLPDHDMGRVMKVAAGVGCRRGVTKQEIEQALEEALRLTGLSWIYLSKIASISLKSDEVALRKLASELKLPLIFYTKSELIKVHCLSSSAFVRRKGGVDSVCEAAAILVANKGKLILPKTKFGRVTIALARVEL